MGLTLRATLDALRPSAQIVVSELIPEIVNWNKGPFAVLAGHHFSDVRVRVWSNSVVDVIAKGNLMLDALLLDTDNGPDCVVHGPNQILYQPQELKQMSRVLMPNGLARFWLVARSPDFDAVMDSESWVWSWTSVGLSSQLWASHHTVYVARKPAAAPAD